MVLTLVLKISPRKPNLLTLSSDNLNLDRPPFPISPPDTPLTITINDPQTLSSFSAELAKAEPNITILAPPPQDTIQSINLTFTLATPCIKTLRVGILSPISADDQLTPLEINGSTHGPVLTPLVQAWREAFRCMPERNAIERVQFDMQCKQECEIRNIVRLLQEVSTGMYVRGKRAMGREVVFEVVGCGEEKKRWLEGSLPGNKEV